MTFVTSEPYIGHLGLGGVGDTKGMLEIRPSATATSNGSPTPRSTSVEPGLLKCQELNDDGSVKKEHELPFKYSMMLPAFKGIDALMGVEGLVNPRGFVLVDKNQRNPTFKNVFGVGVCVAIPPPSRPRSPTGTPKTGYMIESMVTATAHNIAALIDGKEPTRRGHLERRLPRRFRRSRRRLRRPAANPAAQRQLVQRGPLGASGQRSPMRNISSARSARARANRSMSATS